MKKITFLMLLVSSITFAQTSISKNLGDFKTLKVYNGLKVELIKSTNQKIEITGRKAKKVVVKSINNILKIYLRITESFDRDDAKIKIYYNSPIDVIDVNEGAVVNSNDVIEQQKLTVKAQEGARTSLNIAIKYLTVKSVTGGIINLQGTAKMQTIDVNTGGILRAKDLASEQATVTATTGGKAEVSVQDILNAKTRLGGEIYYKGKPDITNKSKFIGGNIKSIK